MQGGHTNLICTYRNKHHPRIVVVATTSIRSTCTHTGIQVISDDGHWDSARAVSVVQLVFTAEGRTERLHTNSVHQSSLCLLYVHNLAVVDALGLSKRINAAF